MAKSILDVMNGERKAVNANVPPLVWNNTAAAHAKAWVEYLAAGKAGGKIVHCFQVPGWEQIESCTHHEGENLVYYAPHDANRSAADYLNFWLSEKKDYHGGPPSGSPVTGHYTQIVWNTTKSVGCGIAVLPPSIVPNGRRRYVVPLLPSRQFAASPLLGEPCSCYGKYTSITL